MKPSALSLERIYPKNLETSNPTEQQTLDEHYGRYQFAAAHLHGHRILDMACGCGYGTYLMAKAHPDKTFVGVDIDADAVAYANQHYVSDNLIFVCHDAMTFSGRVLADGDTVTKFDSVVSLETIEHVAEPEALVANHLAQLNPGGRVIASVPTTPTCDGNPHHLHDFSEKSFRSLFAANGYRVKDDLVFLQTQRWSVEGIFSSKKSVDVRSQGVGNNVLKYYRKHPTALFSRIHAMMKYGFCNRYQTCVFEKSPL